MRFLAVAVLVLLWVSPAQAQLWKPFNTVNIVDGSVTEVKLDATGEADELCLTYEATGSTMEWQACGSGAGDSITVNLGAVTDPDFDDGGDISITDTTNTLTWNIKPGVIIEADLNAGAPTDEFCLTYEDGGGPDLVWQVCGSGVAELTDIADVDIVNPADGQFIVRDQSTDTDWENVSLSGDVSAVTVLGAVTLTDDNATRTNLGLAIGSDTQAWDAELDIIAALTETNDNVMFVAGGVWTSDATPAIDCTDCTNHPIDKLGDASAAGAVQFGSNQEYEQVWTWNLPATTVDANFVALTIAIDHDGTVEQTSKADTSEGQNRDDRILEGMFPDH